MPTAKKEPKITAKVTTPAGKPLTKPKPADTKPKTADAKSTKIVPVKSKKIETAVSKALVNNNVKATEEQVSKIAEIIDSHANASSCATADVAKDTEIALETIEFGTGDKVTWVSNGITKEGRIVAEVPPNAELTPILNDFSKDQWSYQLGSLSPRPDVSFLVSVVENENGKPKLYRPLTSKLNMMADQDDLPVSRYGENVKKHLFMHQCKRFRKLIRKGIIRPPENLVDASLYAPADAKIQACLQLWNDCLELTSLYPTIKGAGKYRLACERMWLQRYSQGGFEKMKEQISKQLAAAFVRLCGCPPQRTKH
jgi:hypothetical protein